MKAFKDKLIDFLDTRESINTIQELPRIDRVECERFPFKIIVDITTEEQKWTVKTQIWLTTKIIDEDIVETEIPILYEQDFDDLLNNSSRYAEEFLTNFCNGIKKWMEFSIK